MGMDVYGKNPTSEVGEYFRNNVWWWRPLWDYCNSTGLLDVKIYESGHCNDGVGLDADGAVKLAAALEALVKSGETQKFADQRQRELNNMPDKACWLCGGTGRRAEPPHIGPGELECNACKETGVLRPNVCSYPFSVENVAEFIDFLKASGGFEIW